jgi:hypothetical protein
MLFRIEPANPRITADDAIILVQSENSPRWLGIPPLRVMEPVKQVSFSFSPGQRFRFRLRANPSVKKRQAGKPNGARVPLLNDERRFEWLLAKGKAGGFEPQPCRITDEKNVTGAKIVGGLELDRAKHSALDCCRWRQSRISPHGSNVGVNRTKSQRSDIISSLPHLRGGHSSGDQRRPVRLSGFRHSE